MVVKRLPPAVVQPLVSGNKSCSSVLVHRVHVDAGGGGVGIGPNFCLQPTLTAGAGATVSVHASRRATAGPGVGVERRVRALRGPARPGYQRAAGGHGEIEASKGLPVSRRRCRQSFAVPCARARAALRYRSD